MAGTSSIAAASLGAVLDRGLVRALLQPIVDIDTGAVVAYEALARGPAGTPLERADVLFAAARRSGRVTELDWLCRAAAVRAALEAGIRPPTALFINVEPEALGTVAPAHLIPLFEQAERELAVVAECTERSLAARPAELLAGLRTMHNLGWRVALDDVGADPASLALLPLLGPEVIKLDLGLVQRRPGADIAATISAVNAEVERSGAVLVAEGIETPEHVRTARSFGAQLGQGFYYGRPSTELLPEGPPARSPLPLPPIRVAEPTSATPFELAAAARAPRAGDKRLLIDISKHLELEALRLGRPAVVLACFQEAAHFGEQTQKRYGALARHIAFVAALGQGMPAEPVPGVRGAVLSGGDLLRGEWHIVVVGPHLAAALLARDLGDHGPEMDRRFEFVLTYDRNIVVRAAAALMERVAPV